MFIVSFKIILHCSLLNSINSHFSFGLSNINWINIQLAGALKQNKFVVNPPYICSGRSVRNISNSFESLMLVIPALFYLFELERRESKYCSEGQLAGQTLSRRGLRANWEDPSVVAVVDDEVQLSTLYYRGYNTNTNTGYNNTIFKLQSDRIIFLNVLT